MLAALTWDLAGRASEPAPFAARDLRPGDPIDETAVEWKAAPRGLFSRPDFGGAFAARLIERGEPITSHAITSGRVIPDGWWAVPVGLPATAAIGSAVRLVLVATSTTVEGVVVAPGADDLLSFSDAGLVAVPEEHAAEVATAAIDGGLVVLLKPVP